MLFGNWDRDIGKVEFKIGEFKVNFIVFIVVFLFVYFFFGIMYILRILN